MIHNPQFVLDGSVGLCWKQVARLSQTIPDIRVYNLDCNITVIEINPIQFNSIPGLVIKTCNGRQMRKNNIRTIKMDVLKMPQGHPWDRAK